MNWCDWQVVVSDKCPECARVWSSHLFFLSGHYQWYGLNVQACADHLSRFTPVSVGCPGRMNDTLAFRRWRVGKLLRAVRGTHFAIGDNAYVQSRVVMTPFN